MVQRVFEAVSPFAGEVIVSIADSSMADALRRFLSRAEYAVDERRGMGPIEGIRRGIEIARGNGSSWHRAMHRCFDPDCTGCCSKSWQLTTRPSRSSRSWIRFGP